jgi:hypothetical protein
MEQQHQQQQPSPTSVTEQSLASKVSPSKKRRKSFRLSQNFVLPSRRDIDENSSSNGSSSGAGGLFQNTDSNPVSESECVKLESSEDFVYHVADQEEGEEEAAAPSSSIIATPVTPHATSQSGGGDDDSSFVQRTKTKKRRVEKMAKCWLSFTPINDNDARCNICSRTICTSGNTSNAWAHLEQHHYDVYLEAKSKKP